LPGGLEKNVHNSATSSPEIYAISLVSTTEAEGHNCADIGVMSTILSWLLKRRQSLQNILACICLPEYLSIQGMIFTKIMQSSQNY